MQQDLPPMAENAENTSESTQNDVDSGGAASNATNSSNTPGKNYESSFKEFMAKYESRKDVDTPKLSEESDHEREAPMDTDLVNGKKDKKDDSLQESETKVDKSEPIIDIEKIEKIDKLEKHERKKHRSGRRKEGKVGRPRSSLRSSRDRPGDDLPVKRARQPSGSSPTSPSGFAVLNSSFPGTMVASGGATYGFATQGGGPAISPGGLSSLFHAAGAGGDMGRKSNKLTG